MAQGKLAYKLFQETFSGERWDALAALGARVQRPLWASTSTKNPEYPDTLYVDNLIGPHTVNTLPDSTIEAFAEHGTLSRTIDHDVEAADVVWSSLAAVGVDMDDVAAQLEREGVASFQKSFTDSSTPSTPRPQRDSDATGVSSNPRNRMLRFQREPTSSKVSGSVRTARPVADRAGTRSEPGCAA